MRASAVCLFTNTPDTDFPLQNLPFGCFKRRGSAEPWRIGVAIGEQVFDLKLALSQCPWSRDIEPSRINFLHS